MGIDSLQKNKTPITAENMKILLVIVVRAYEQFPYEEYLARKNQGLPELSTDEWMERIKRAQ